MACPALPLCGLAVTEAERSLPGMLPRLRSLLNRLGLEDLDALVVRVTGALTLQREAVCAAGRGDSVFVVTGAGLPALLGLRRAAVPLAASVLAMRMQVVCLHGIAGHMRVLCEVEGAAAAVQP